MDLMVSEGEKVKAAPSGLEIRGLSASYDGKEVLKGIDLTIPAGKVTAIIGPSGCGKTTLLRCVNRLSDVTRGCKVQGEIYLAGESINRMDPVLLRRRVGMVFQKPNPFSMSVRENVLYGVRAAGLKVEHQFVVRSSLQKAALWEDIKNRLGQNALHLSLGEQQRLCIARTVATSPEVILMDEPAASLDPLSASKVEETIASMRGEYTVVLVTHNLRHARRVSDCAAFVYLGQLIEFGETSRLLDNPQKEKTREYVAGGFG
jgi:phosphate transport system ATP-binding protein